MTFINSIPPTNLHPVRKGPVKATGNSENNTPSSKPGESESPGYFAPTPKPRPAILQVKPSDITPSGGASVEARIERAYRHLVSKFPEYRNVSLDTLMAQAEVESTFNPKSVSSQGARGLMQIMPATAKYLLRNILKKGGIVEYILNGKIQKLTLAKLEKLKGNSPELRAILHSVSNSVHMNMEYMSELMDQYGNEKLALAAYNGGIRGPRNYKAGVQGEVTNYVKRVRLAKAEYR